MTARNTQGSCSFTNFTLEPLCKHHVIKCISWPGHVTRGYDISWAFWSLNMKILWTKVKIWKDVIRHAAFGKHHIFYTHSRSDSSARIHLPQQLSPHSSVPVMHFSNWGILQDGTGTLISESQAGGWKRGEDEANNRRTKRYWHVVREPVGVDQLITVPRIHLQTQQVGSICYLQVLNLSNCWRTGHHSCLFYMYNLLLVCVDWRVTHSIRWLPCPLGWYCCYYNMGLCSCDQPTSNPVLPNCCQGLIPGCRHSEKQIYTELCKSNMKVNNPPELNYDFTM